MKARPRFAVLASSLLFLVFFLIFVRTFCASIYCDDSGETATLAWTLSIGHPPGYPLHTLLAHLFSFIPLGDPGLRVSLFAAFLGALCAPLAFWCCGGRSGGLLAACLIGLGPVFWHNADTAKGSVYMLNNVLSLAALYCAEKKHARSFWLIFGLGLANHYMSQLVLLPCYLLLLRQDGWKASFKNAWLVLPGISLYLYLPLRAAQNPAINWNHIRSWNDFVFYIFRWQYAAGEVSRGVSISWAQFSMALKDIFLEGHGFACLLALYALYWAWASRNLQRLALGLGLLIPLLAVTLYLNLSTDRLDIMQPYLFPAYLCSSLLAATALEKMKPWSLPLWLAMAMLPAALGWSRQDKSNYYYATDNARNVLACLPRGAALFASGDAIIFPLWYLQNVKHERPDVALVGGPVLPMAWVRESLARDYPALQQPQVVGPIGAESIDRLIYGFLELNRGGMPLYFSYNKINNGIPWTLLPQGPVYLAMPPDSKPPATFLGTAKANLAVCVTRGYEKADLDARTHLLIVRDFAIHHNALAHYLEEERKDYPDALDEYSQAQVLDPQNEEFPYNCGNVLYEMGRYAEAPLFYKRSLELNGRYINSWFNLAAVDMRLGNTLEACEALRKVLELDPSRKDIQPYLLNCPKPQ